MKILNYVKLESILMILNLFMALIIFVIVTEMVVQYSVSDEIMDKRNVLSKFSDKEGKVFVIIYFNYYPTDNDFKEIKSYGGMIVTKFHFVSSVAVKIQQDNILLLYKIRNVRNVEIDEPVQLCCGDNDS